MKAILFSLFFTIIFCSSNLRQTVLLQDSNDYVEDNRGYDQFLTVTICKINKCIMEKRYRNLAAIYGEFSKKFNQEQQKCFQLCQINSKCGRKEDEQGRKMNGIYDESEAGFFDTAPSKTDIKSYLSANENKVLRRFLEKHMWIE